MTKLLDSRERQIKSQLGVYCTVARNAIKKERNRYVTGENVNLY